MLTTGKKERDALIRLIDEYSIFYLRWMEGRRKSGEGTFTQIQGSPSWRAWSGYALESLVQRHLPQLKIVYLSYKWP